MTRGQFWFAMEYVAGTEPGDAGQGRARPLSDQAGLPTDLSDPQGARASPPARLRPPRHQAREHPDRPRRPTGSRVKISDFGLAKSFRGVGLSGLTFSGEMRGTVPFMPPEQMLDFKTVTPLADLYATAATLYYLLTCQYIYDESAGGGDLIRMLLEETPIPIRTRRRRCPPGPRRGHREMPRPRPEGPLSGRHRHAQGVEGILLTRPWMSFTTSEGFRNSRL